MAQSPLAAERQARISDLVRRHRAVRVSDLVSEFGVSAMTVRRDIELLEERGVLERVHGGARLPVALGSPEPDPVEKSRLQPDAKDGIATAALGFVRSGTVVGIGAGTSTLALAGKLADRDDLTVVTNSIPVADALRASKGVSVVLTGGTRTISDALVGPVASASVASLNIDVLFLGAHGFDADRAFTAPNLLEAEMNRQLMRRAVRTVVLADATKWGVIGLGTFAELDEVDALVTDTGLPDPARAVLSDRMQRLILAEPPRAGFEEAASTPPRTERGRHGG